MNKLNIIISIIIITIFNLSCSKDTDSVEGNTSIPDSDYSLSFKIEDVDQDDFVENITSNTKIENNNLNTISKKKELVQIGEELDALITLEEEIVPQQKAIQNNSKNGKLIAANSELTTGAKYRVVIFNTDQAGNATTYFTQAEGTKGQILKLPVYRNKKYRWYTYSYNNTGSIPQFVNETPTVLVKGSKSSNAANKNDFMYETGLITTNNVLNGDNPISIVLKRKTAAINLVVNSQGAFAPISNLTSFISYGDNGLKQGTFDIKTGLYTSVNNIPRTGADTATFINNADWQNYTDLNSVNEATPANYGKSLELYTPVNGSALNLKINISSLSLNRDRIQDNSGSTTTSLTTFRKIRSKLFDSFIPMPGKRYKITIDIIESPIQVGGINWARGNVYRLPGTALGGLGAYRFRYDNPTYTSVNYIPNYEHFTTDIFNVRSTGKNICQLVYPKDVWTIPSSTQVTSSIISNTESKAVSNPGPTTEMWYIYWGGGETDGFRHGSLIFVPLGYKLTMSSAVSEYNPGNVTANIENSKGYWRTNTANILLRLSKSNNTITKELITVDQTSTTYLYAVRCIRQ